MRKIHNLSSDILALNIPEIKKKRTKTDGNTFWTYTHYRQLIDGRVISCSDRIDKTTLIRSPAEKESVGRDREWCEDDVEDRVEWKLR